MIATPGYEPPAETDSEFIAKHYGRMTAEERNELDSALVILDEQAAIAETLGHFTESFFWAQNSVRQIKARIAMRIRRSIANPESGHSV